MQHKYTCILYIVYRTLKRATDTANDDYICTRYCGWLDMHRTMTARPRFEVIDGFPDDCTCGTAAAADAKPSTYI